MRGVRYRHVMSRAKRAKQPDCIIGVAIESVAEPVTGRKGVEKLRLVRWHTCVSSVMPACRASRIETAGSDCSTFWEVLERAGSRYRHIFVVSADAVTDWALLGLWEALEDERIRIAGRAESGPGGANGGDLGLERPQEGKEDRVCAEDQRRGSAAATGFLVTEDPPSILYAYLRKGGALIRWVDVRNYGVRPQSIPWDRRQNAQLLTAIVCGMVDTLAKRNLGALKDTAGAQALHSFRYKHLQHLITCHTVESVLQIEKSAYYSGRCECGRIGFTEGPVYELDIRGAYTFTCATELVPVRLRSYSLAPAAGEMPKTGGGRGMVATVTIETGEPAYPLRRSNLTIWPTGRFLTTLAGPELQDAIDNGRVVKWHQWAEYDLAPALASYAREAYAMRECFEEQGYSALAAWAKSLAVSLVGKLAQRGRSWQWLQDRPPRYYYDQYHMRHTDGRVHRFQEIAGVHRMESLEGWGADACPAIAAWICSAARMRLLAMLRCCGRGECWYVDTDCLFTTDVGYQRLVDAGWVRQGQLGFLQVKGCHEWFEPRGVKSYILPSRSVQTGYVQGDACYPGSPARNRHSVWVATHLDRGTRPQAERVTTKWERIKPYLHGHVSMGGRVKPFQMWED